MWFNIFSISSVLATRTAFQSPVDSPEELLQKVLNWPCVQRPYHVAVRKTKKILELDRKRPVVSVVSFFGHLNIQRNTKRNDPP